MSKKRTRKRRVSSSASCKYVAKNQHTAKRNYKDTVFRTLFKDASNLLQLYNAINGTSYDNPDDLTVTTLENAIYMSVKNDVSCMVDMRLDLYEHQSTVNPNIPLRDLHYVSDTFLKFHTDTDIYSPRIIPLPNPRFIVFYNGEDEQPAIKSMRLSDAYVHNEETPQLELIVTQININPGYNDEFLNSCPILGAYMTYVDRVRTYQKQMPLVDAVDKAVDECINEGVLADFLKKNKAVVKNMSIYEFNKELHDETMMGIGREEGKIEGKVIAYYDMGCSMEDIAAKMNLSIANIQDIISMELQSN